MIQLSNNINTNGLTFSAVNPNIYNEFEVTKDAGIFENVVSDLMLNKYSDDKELTEYILSLPKDKQRMAVLSLIDGDNVLWSKMNTFVNECDDELAHIKDVIEIMFQFVKEVEVEKKKFGEVMTPLDLVRDILRKLPKDVWSNPNLKWLDPANGAGTFPLVIIHGLMKGLADWEPNVGKRYKHIIENMIYTCELQSRNVFLWLCGVDPKDKYTTNTYWGSFLDNDFDFHMKNVWGVDKFDIVVANPPYNQMIDMQFLTKSYNLSDKVLFVHPSTWLLDEKCKQSKFINAKKLVGEHLESIELFNGNKIFGISLFMPCVITYIDKFKTISGVYCFDRIKNVELMYNNIDEINKYSNIDVYNSIKNKISNLTIDNIDNHKIFNISTDRNSTVGKIKKFKHLNTTNEYYVNIAQIRGNVYKNDDVKMIQDDFYTIVTKDNKVERKIDNHMFYKFTSNEEAENFLSYIKTNFSRFCLSVYKNNSQLECGEMSFIPYLDFNERWDDNKLFEHFGFTDDEKKFINDNIANYYE